MNKAAIKSMASEHRKYLKSLEKNKIGTWISE